MTKKQATKYEDFKDELEYIDEINDLFSFEKYCGACMFFNTDDCQYLDNVSSDTEWAKIRCSKFYD